MQLDEKCPSRNILYVIIDKNMSTTCFCTIRYISFIHQALVWLYACEHTIKHKVMMTQFRSHSAPKSAQHVISLSLCTKFMSPCHAADARDRGDTNFGTHPFFRTPIFWSLMTTRSLGWPQVSTLVSRAHGPQSQESRISLEIWLSGSESRGPAWGRVPLVWGVSHAVGGGLGDAVASPRCHTRCTHRCTVAPGCWGNTGQPVCNEFVTVFHGVTKQSCVIIMSAVFVFAKHVSHWCLCFLSLLSIFIRFSIISRYEHGWDVFYVIIDGLID